MKVYNYKATKNNGEEISLSEFKNKVVLIINSATECGFTPQYDDLQDLYEKYAEQDFVILDFPCNQFGKQAPGSNDEIASFCQSRYGVTFPIFEKIDVNGENAHPLFKFLKSQKSFQGFDNEHPLTGILNSMLAKEDPNFAASADIKWNFTKFLIDKEGNVVERFEPTTEVYLIEQKVKGLL